MLEEPTCYTRECKHFMGITGYKEPDQYFICKAFPDGIPDKITYGDNLHLEPLKDQGNDIVYTHNQGEEYTMEQNFGFPLDNVQRYVILPL